MYIIIILYLIMRVIIHRKYNMLLIIYWQLFIHYFNFIHFASNISFNSFSALFVFSDKVEIGIRKTLQMNYYGHEKEHENYPYCPTAS